MDELIEKERQKLMRWQQVKQNRESSFAQELNRFQHEIEARKSRLSRILGNELLAKQHFSANVSQMRERRGTNLSRHRDQRQADENERHDTAKKMQQESYAYVSDNEILRDQGVDRMSHKRAGEKQHRQRVKEQLS